MLRTEETKQKTLHDEYKKVEKMQSKRKKKEAKTKTKTTTNIYSFKINNHVIECHTHTAGVQ